MSFVWIASLLFLTTSSLSYLCFIFFQSHNKDRETILSVNEKAVFITAVFCTLMFTALLYSKIGSHEDVIVAQLLENETPSSEDSEINEELIDNMRRSLDKRPQNVLYAVLLANYEKSQGNFDAASEFYDLALSYSPDDPNLLSQYAENLFLANDRSFNESVNQAIERAYKADSNQPIILGLMGVRAYLDNNFEEAIFFWQRGLDNTEKNDPYYKSYLDGVRKAEEKILMNQ